MLRQKTACYALLVMYDIASKSESNGRGVGIRSADIADRHQLPRAYAAKILSQLAGSEILRSDRGPRGGFRLARDAKEITLHDIFDSVGALENFADDSGLPEQLPASIETAMKSANRAAIEHLQALFERTSLAEIVASNGHNGNGSRVQVENFVPPIGAQAI